MVIAETSDGSVAGIQLGEHRPRIAEGAGVLVLESIRDAIDVIEENHRVVEAVPTLFGLVCVHGLRSLSQFSK